MEDKMRLVMEVHGYFHHSGIVWLFSATASISTKLFYDLQFTTLVARKIAFHLI